MTPAIFRHDKCFPDGNINSISNGGGLIPIIETGSYGRPQSHINCLRVINKQFAFSFLACLQLCGAQYNDTSKIIWMLLAMQLGLPKSYATQGLKTVLQNTNCRKKLAKWLHDPARWAVSAVMTIHNEAEI